MIYQANPYKMKTLMITGPGSLTDARIKVRPQALENISSWPAKYL